MSCARAILVGGDDAQPIPDVVLLEVPLGEVLQIPAGNTNGTTI